MKALAIFGAAVAVAVYIWVAVRLVREVERLLDRERRR